MPWLHRYIGNPLLSGLLNFFFHTPIRDAHCGMRAFSKGAYERLQLRSTGMEFASEMIVQAQQHGLRMSEIPIVLRRDGRGHPSHLRTFRDGWRHLRLLLLLCPLWLYLMPSALLLITGLGLLSWVTSGPPSLGNGFLDVRALLLSLLCLLLGYQTLWLWACAKMYGWSTGLLPQRTLSIRLFEHLTMERGLLAGGTLLLAGLGWTLWLGHGSSDISLDPLNVQTALRHSLCGFAMIFLGVQTITGSFFLSMLGMQKAHPQSAGPVAR
jgi:hypothetical protein